MPEGAHIEGSGDLTCDAAIEDCHLLVADPEARRLYELYQATQEGEGLSAGRYHDLGITEFVLSGHPHLEEAYWVGEGVLPELGRRGLWTHPAGTADAAGRHPLCPVAGCACLSVPEHGQALTRP